jgi:hypothetical protein
MRISFDLDDTLIPHDTRAAREPLRLPVAARFFGIERLRAGTRPLFSELRRRGHSIWIYSSSLRPHYRVDLSFRWHGLRIDGIVTFDAHTRACATNRLSLPPTKYPPAFDINLHVDDAEGVRIEGERHGFRVLIVAPDDDAWLRLVLEAVDSI